MNVPKFDSRPQIATIIGRRDPVGFLDASEQRRGASRQRPCARADRRGRQPLREIGVEALRQLRLRAIARDDDRLRARVRQRAVDGRLADAACERLGAQSRRGSSSNDGGRAGWTGCLAPRVGERTRREGRRQRTEGQRQRIPHLCPLPCAFGLSLLLFLHFAALGLRRRDDLARAGGRAPRRSARTPCGTRRARRSCDVSVCS